MRFTTQVGWLKWRRQLNERLTKTKQNKMKTTVDLSDGSEKTVAVISKSDASVGLTLMVSQRFSFEENFTRIFLNRSQSIQLRDFLNENIN